MNSFHLHPAKTALVIIDLQQGIVAMPAVPHSSSEIVQKSALLAKQLREKGGTVVYVRVDIANVLQLPVDAPYRASNAPRLRPPLPNLSPQPAFNKATC
jgi:nicotinamidase-related amidase